jgi:hypothetical protein
VLYSDDELLSTFEGYLYPSSDVTHFQPARPFSLQGDVDMADNPTLPRPRFFDLIRRSPCPSCCTSESGYRVDDAVQRLECAGCGWSVTGASLVAGETAFYDHDERCVRVCERRMNC